jgi:hypothetical protein
MRIRVDGTDGRFLGGLTAPPVGVGDKEKLFFGKMLQTRQQGVRGSGIPLLPSVKSRRQSSGVSEILTQCQTSVHVQWFGVGIRAWNGEIRVLVNEALGSLLEGFDGLIVPPVGVISGLVIVPTGGIESYDERYQSFEAKSVRSWTYIP